MNCLFQASSHTISAIFSKTSRAVSTTCLHRFSTLSWSRNPVCAGVKTNCNPELAFSSFRVHCYSSADSSSSGVKPRSRKSKAKSVTEEEKDEFFLVRKGDIVGVYRSFTDCQAQVGSSIRDPPVSVYKGYSMRKDTEEYLLSSGLKNALYTIRAEDFKDDLFGSLVACPLQLSDSTIDEGIGEDVPKKGALEEVIVGSTTTSTDPLKKHVKLDTSVKAQVPSSGHRTCILEFDGASKGNPGKGGAGAVLRDDAGNLICRLREGLGIATNNVAEYRALILGLRHALEKGYTDPLSLVRDHRVKEILTAQGIAVHSLKANLLYEPWEVNDTQGHPFTTFAAFWERCLSMPYDPESPLLPPKRIISGDVSRCPSDVLVFEDDLEKEAMRFCLVHGHLIGAIRIRLSPPSSTDH